MATFPKFPFDPMQMMEAMQSSFTSMMPKTEMPNLTPEAMMAAQQKNLDAFMAANTAASEAYQALFKKQLEVFEATISEAQDRIKDFDPANPTANPEIATAVAETAFKNMATLAEEAQKANSKAFEIMQKRVAETVKELQGG